MEVNEILNYLIYVFVTSCLGILVKFGIQLIETKVQELKSKTNNELLNSVISEFTELVTECVESTEQTFVKVTKDAGMWNDETKSKAAKLAFESVKELLSDRVSETLSSAYVDLDSYIKAKIESVVYKM